VTGRQVLQRLEGEQYRLTQLQAQVDDARQAYEAELVKDPAAPSMAERRDEGAILDARAHWQRLAVEAEEARIRIAHLEAQAPTPEAQAAAMREGAAIAAQLVEAETTMAETWAAYLTQIEQAEGAARAVVAAEAARYQLRARLHALCAEAAVDLAAPGETAIAPRAGEWAARVARLLGAVAASRSVDQQLDAEVRSLRRQLDAAAAA
jgi:hypothetical protein